MRFPLSLPVAVVVALGALTACRDHPDGLLSTSQDRVVREQAVVPPAPLAVISVGSGSASIWPYLTDNLETPQDPVNLIFTGIADPRAIRNVLFGLDGDRAPVFPPVFPFTCTWSDAIGGLMAGYGEEAGWGGTAVQLQCGVYGPIRFHLRLLKLGGFTIGNVHFEVVIPGTTDHQVLSWELAEQLVTYDMVRSGLLGAAPADAGGINAAPSHRTIPAVIYNGLPADLKALIGGPPGDVAADVGIATNGHATSFLLAGAVPAVTPFAEQHFVIQFNQVIPKPFCATGPSDFLLVQGPISLDQEVSTLPTGQLGKVFRADGELTAIPFDVFTGRPAGAPLGAKVSEHQESRAGDEGGDVQGTQHQQLLPESSPGTGQLLILINVTPGKAPQFDRNVTCQ